MSPGDRIAPGEQQGCNSSCRANLAKLGTDGLLSYVVWTRGNTALLPEAAGDQSCPLLSLGSFIYLSGMLFFITRYAWFFPRDSRSRITAGAGSGPTSRDSVSQTTASSPRTLDFQRPGHPSTAGGSGQKQPAMVPLHPQVPFSC